MPWTHIGKEAWARGTPTSVMVYVDDERVATHSRRASHTRSTQDEHLPRHRADLRHRSREYWEKRADRIGPEVGEFIHEVFDADDVLSQLRTVQAMVTHLENFPPERGLRACQRARFYGNHTYQGLKDILRKALDLEPLPVQLSLDRARLAKPRFARPVNDLIPLPLEITDAPN